MDRDTLRREVKDLLASGLRLQIASGDIPDDAPIFGETLGLDSIDALELVVLVEDRFHVSIPDEEVGRRAFGSVNALVDFILAERPGKEAAANDPGERGGSRAARWLLAPPSSGVPSGTPRRSSLRLPLSLPGSFALLTMITRTASYAALVRPRRSANITSPTRSRTPSFWKMLVRCVFTVRSLMASALPTSLFL